jgi:hypothetical protein
MNTRRSAVWIQIKESASSTFRPAARCGTFFVLACISMLAVVVTSSLHAQNAAPTQNKDKSNTNIKIITDKDGKSDIIELNGEDVLAKPEIAKMLKDLKIDIAKLKKDLRGTTNLSVKRVVKTDGNPTSSAEEVTITRGCNGNKNECVVIVSSDTSKCKAMNSTCSKKSSCVIETTNSKDGKQCKVICINKNIGDNVGQTITASASTADTDSELHDSHSSELPKHVFVHKFNDDDGDNVAVIDAELTPNDDEITIASNDDDNHARSMKFIIKQQNESGDPSKIRVMIRKYVADEVRITEPKQSKTEEIPSTLNLSTLNLAPNPNKGQFTLSFSLKETGNTTISIADIAGHEVYSESLANFTGEYNKSLDLTAKSRGEYLLKITQNGKSATASIILE